MTPKIRVPFNHRKTLAGLMNCAFTDKAGPMALHKFIASPTGLIQSGAKLHSWDGGGDGK